MQNAKETIAALKVVDIRNTASNLLVTPTLQKYQTKKGAKVRAGALELRALFDA